jgi:predicted Rossmann-fold nucleotide-binding protein
MSDFGSICVFCGSQPGARPEYLQAARDLGERLAKQGIGKAADAQRNGRPVRAWTDDFNNLFEVLR